MGKAGGKRGPALTDHPLNREAANYLVRARRSRPHAPDMVAFAAELSPVLGFDLAYDRYNAWETGRSTVPAAAIFAAFRLTGLPVADPEAEQTLEGRLAAIEGALEEIRSELRARREIRLLGSAAPLQGESQP